MNILHYYPADDSMISQYASMLEQHMTMGMVCFFATTLPQAIQLMQMADIQILHVHGCWRTSAARLYRLARKKGTRLVVSPHGALEPWIMDSHYWTDKLPKRIAFQQNMIRSAYAVVVQGNMEKECLDKLKWNSRTIVVRNPIITCSTTPQQATQQLCQLYRRIMDSNTLQLMNSETLDTLKSAIKAGICKDTRWLALPPNYAPPRLNEESWRQLLCYAQQEHISNMVGRGLLLLRCELPDMDIQHANPFLPNHYAAIKSINEAIGLHYANENERLVAAFKYVRRLLMDNKLTISHLCELSKELFEYGCNEEQLQDDLREKGLTPMANRIVQLLADMTGLNEGFLPLQPLNDKTTRKIKRQIKNHLTI